MDENVKEQSGVRMREKPQRKFFILYYALFKMLLLV